MSVKALIVYHKDQIGIVSREIALSQNPVVGHYLTVHGNTGFLYYKILAISLFGEDSITHGFVEKSSAPTYTIYCELADNPSSLIRPNPLDDSHLKEVPETYWKESNSRTIDFTTMTVS
jgi:hypothetical protein